jgi:hypothetical protein
MARPYSARYNNWTLPEVEGVMTNTGMPSVEEYFGQIEDEVTATLRAKKYDDEVKNRPRLRL